jgi:hypothetical protein
VPGSNPGPVQAIDADQPRRHSGRHRQQRNPDQPLATFEQLASYFDISVASFAVANQDLAGLIATDFQYKGTPITVTPQDTLVTLAAKAKTTVEDLATTLEAETGLLKIGLPVHSVDSLPEYSLSTSKFPLSLNGKDPTSFLTFFVNLRSDSAARRAFFDLDFRINQLEYNITAVNGISDYQASSWLSFVLPIEGSNNPSAPTALGQVVVPIPLRSYPTPPLLLTQSGDGTADLTHLQDTPLWNYQYAFQYQEAAQDTIGTTLTFNSDVPASPRSRTMLRGTPADLFDGLAQFIFVADALMADLAGLPAWTPGSSQTTLGPAIAAFSTIVQGIASTWGTWVEVKSQLTATSGPGQTYAYQLVNSRRSIGNGREILDELTVRIDGTPGAPLPTAAWVLVNGTMTPMVQVGDEEGEEVTASDTEVSFKYPDQIPAESSVQQQLQFGPLDVLSYQDAWAGIYVTRNEGLLDWPPTNPDMVYTTPLVRFTNLYQPLINRDESFDIAPPIPPAGLAAMLAAGLQSAFSAIFASGASAHYVKLVAGYSYDLAPGLSRLTTGLSPVAPILMLPQLQYDPAVQQPVGGAPGPLATNVANAVFTWQQLNLTPGRSGNLVVDFTVFANVAPVSVGVGAPTVAPGNPVLDLKRLYLTFAAESAAELVVQA